MVKIRSSATVASWSLRLLSPCLCCHAPGNRNAVVVDSSSYATLASVGEIPTIRNQIGQLVPRVLARHRFLVATHNCFGICRIAWYKRSASKIRGRKFDYARQNADMDTANIGLTPERLQTLPVVARPRARNRSAKRRKSAREGEWTTQAKSENKNPTSSFPTNTSCFHSV